MRCAPEISLVVDACHLEGRHERLDALLAQLEMCEKALQVPLWSGHTVLLWCECQWHRDHALVHGRTTWRPRGSRSPASTLLLQPTFWTFSPKALIRSWC